MRKHFFGGPAKGDKDATLQVLLAAEQEAAGGSIEPRDVLLAIFSLPTSHAREVLERQGVALAELCARLAEEPRRATPAAVAPPQASDTELDDSAALDQQVAPEERRALRGLKKSKGEAPWVKSPSKARTAVSRSTRQRPTAVKGRRHRASSLPRKSSA